MTWEDFNGRHPNTTQCSKEAERKRRRLAAEEARAVTERDFVEYGRLITNMIAFKYLGHTLTATDGDCLAAVSNLRKERKKWLRISRIIV